MANTASAVLIGFIVTLTLIVIAGAVTIGVCICIKWREAIKRRQVLPTRSQSRQPTRRHSRIRVQRAQTNNRSNNTSNLLEPPPPYSEIDVAPPPYTLLNPNLLRQGSSRGNTRGSSRLVTPSTGARTDSTARHSSFSIHLNTGSTNTPRATPTGNMFTSSAVATRELSVISDCRQTNNSDAIT